MERKEYVDAVKCLAIFFVLANHIGLIIPGVSSFGGMFYVPVFFVLSGYTYHVSNESFGQFARKKAKRLLVPYAAANVVCFAVFAVKDILKAQAGVTTFRPLIGILYSRYSLFPPDAGVEEPVLFLTVQNSPTWFLTAFFLTCLLFEVCVRLADGRLAGGRVGNSGPADSGLAGSRVGNSGLADGRLGNSGPADSRLENGGIADACLENGLGGKGLRKTGLLVSALLCLLLGTALHYICPVLLPWSLECVPLFAVYMLSGYLFGRWELCRRWWEQKGVLPYCGLLMLGAVVRAGFCLCGSANISVGHFGRFVTIGVLNGISSSLLVLLLCARLSARLPKAICLVGRHTLHILCYHLLVFLLLKAASNLFLPGILEQHGAAALLVKLGIVVASAVLITWTDLRVLPRVAKSRIV